MCAKVSTCLYIDKVVLETAKLVGLNLSRVSENALKAAIGRMEGEDHATEPRRDPDELQNIGSPGEIRTLASGSRARHP